MDGFTLSGPDEGSQLTPSLQNAHLSFKGCCLFRGRKAMTNLDGILKSRNITLLTQVWLVKAMIFAVFMHGWESWTIKLVSIEELILLNYGVGENS